MASSGLALVKTRKQRRQHRKWVTAKTAIVVGLVLIVIVYFAYSFLASNSSASNATTRTKSSAGSSTTSDGGPCSDGMGQYCFFPIRPIGANNFVTSINGTVYFDSDTNESTNIPQCSGPCFSIQMNSNGFDSHAWVQIVTTINFTEQSGLTVHLDYQVYWLDSTRPSVTCNGELGWQYRVNPITGAPLWICDNLPPKQYSLDSPNGDIPATSEFTTAATFHENGTVGVTMDYYWQGKERVSQTLDVMGGFNPYGQITTVYQVVVGVEGGRATFSSGSMLRLYLRPVTNTGDVFGVNWEEGGTAFPTAESSNLLIDNVTYTDNAQFIKAYA